MDAQGALLSHALGREDGYEVLLEQGIDLTYFGEPEHARIFEWMGEHYRRYGASPGLDALRRNYPTYELTKATDSLDFYVNDLRRERLHNTLKLALRQSGEAMVDVEPEQALKILQEALLELEGDHAGSANVDLTLTMDERIEDYRDWAGNEGMLRGISTGYRTIDRATRGIQPGQFVVIVGDQKSGKSAILQDMANTMNNAGNKVLMWSFEMGLEDVGARHDAFRAGINYGKLLDGRTDRAMVQKLRRASRKAKDGHPLILIEDQLATTTVSQIGAVIRREKPDAVLIDGMYFIEDEHGEAPNSNAALVNISRGLRRVIRQTGVPIIGTTQALHRRIGSKGISEKSVGYTTAFNQDCHVMLGLQPTDNGKVELRVMLSRSGPKTSAALVIDWDNGKIFEEEITDDVDRGEEDSDAEAAEPTY